MGDARTVQEEERMEENKKKELAKCKDLAREIRKLQKKSVYMTLIVVGTQAAVENLEEELTHPDIGRRPTGNIFLLR